MAMKEGLGLKNPTAEEMELINTPAAVTVTVAGDSKTVEGIEALIVLGYTDEGDKYGVSAMSHGRMNAIRLGHMLNGIRSMVGDNMFMQAVIMEAAIDIGVNPKEEDDGE